MQKDYTLIIILILYLIFLIIPIFEVQGADNFWSPSGPYGVRITGLSIHPNNGQIIIATTPDGEYPVYKSIDGGLTWNSSSMGLDPDGGEISSIIYDPKNTNILYLPYQAGVYKSVDGGENWELKSTAIIDGGEYIIRPWSLDISPLDGTLYAGVYGAYLGLHGGVFKSIDGGETWVQVADEVETDGIISALAISPSAPHIIYAGGYSGGGIFKSTDNGTTWISIGSSFGVLPEILSLLVDPHDSQVVYMGTARDGIYKTTDGGQSWIPIGNGLGSSDIRDIIIDPGNQQVIYAGGGPNLGTGIPGIYKSLDNYGGSWTEMMEGMGSRAIYSLAIDVNDPQNIYAGTGSGVWKYTVIAGPEDYSVMINNSELFSNDTSVNLSLTAPSGTSEMIVSNDGGFNDAVWEPYSTNKPWIITSYEENFLPRIVYAKFKRFGVVSGLYQDDIIIDTVSPTGSVQIIEDSSNDLLSILEVILQSEQTIYFPIVMNIANPGQIPIYLSFSANDNLSGVDRMMVSSSKDFDDSEWMQFKTSMIFWVPIADENIVFVKYQDRAGNVSEIYSDSTIN